MTEVTTGRSGTWRSRTWRGALGVLGAVGLLGGTGCSLDSLLKSDQVPKEVADPAVTETPAGARAAYNGTLSVFSGAFAGEFPGLGNNHFGDRDRSFAAQSGLLSDELTNVPVNNGQSGSTVDQRALPEGTGAETDGTYSALQQVRGHASQAIGLLEDFLPDEPALRGHLYALQGYAELLLAELFCSGVPLGTLDYHGDFTYQPGSTTDEILNHAIAKFDTALALAGDSTRFVQLAEVGRARALLGRGDYSAAAAAVSTVPDDYRYEMRYQSDSVGSTAARNFIAKPGGSRIPLLVPNGEGLNGIPWRTSGDPRTPVDTTGFPTNYDPLGGTPIVLASGLEARLIEAETQLQAAPEGGTWLATLNVLRTDGTFDLPDTLVDTLGVTGCTPSSICGASPASNAITQGQPANYPPAGYAVASADTTYPAPAGIQNYCASSSWYAPCAQGDSMVVYVYVKPAFWHAGSGGVAGLAPLADPGTAGARVDLLFRERAFWLFLTGHRQGDLRRLIRQYGRVSGDLYPTGVYQTNGLLGTTTYGEDVTAPIPSAEFVNPLYTGCRSRGA